MRILMLSWEYPPRVIGGVAPHVRDLARALTRLGHHVTVLTGCHPGARDVASDRGVHVHRVRSPFPAPPDFTADVMQQNMAFLERGLQLVRAGAAFDIIHCHDWLVAPAGRALKGWLRRPLVATVHATEFGRNGGLHNPLQRYIGGMEWWLGYEAERVITCSRYMRDEVMRVLTLPADKVDVVPNGVDPAEFRLPPAARRQVEELRNRLRAAGQAIIFFMGRLVWEKGAQDLIDAMPAVRSRVPGARLVVAGDGPLRRQLMDRAEGRGLGSGVCFPGFVSGARRQQLLALADVAVFPSRYEPFGIVALEAMAAGVPVVVGDTGGLAEVVRAGVNGLKAVPGDPESIARCIVSVLTDPGLARRLTSRALDIIVADYDWGAIARRTEGVYRQAVEAWARRGGREAVDAGPVPEKLPSPLALRMLSRTASVPGRYHGTGGPDGVEAREWEPLPAR